jgi:heme/copper-type cytochrome/quinol oxidase subunit 2
MLQSVQLILFIIIVILLLISVYFSFRYRREQNPQKRGIYASYMNICMGFMLIAIAITQLFFFTDSAFRRIFGTICLLLGLFNVFAGFRNYGMYQRMKR